MTTEPVNCSISPKAGATDQGFQRTRGTTRSATLIRVKINYWRSP